MLGLLYILLFSLLGDAIVRRFLTSYSVQQRLASGFLIGMLFSAISTYLAALVFSSTGQPLLWANLVFLGIAIAGIYFLPPKNEEHPQPGDGGLSAVWKWLNKPSGAAPSEKRTFWNSADRPAGTAAGDILCLALLTIPAVWIVFATLDFSGGSFLMSIKGWSDFGANLSLTQSFALGSNYPTTHPFYPDETIRYHFMFWFQAANVAFLGLNTVWAVNLLSILSIISLLILIMSFCETLFASRAAGRIAAVTFFLATSSLSFIPFFAAQSSLADAFGAIVRSTDFLNSGYDFRGETWGALTVNVYATQRHLISGVGLFLIVCIHLIQFYKKYEKHLPETQQPTVASNGELKSASAETENEPTVEIDGEASSSEIEHSAEMAFEAEDRVDEASPPNKTPLILSPALPKPTVAEIISLVFCGILIGLLPYWNSAVFVSAAIVIGGALLFLPKRPYLLILIGSSIAVGLPQVLMLRSGTIAETGNTLFQFGYTVANPTIALVLEYIGWTFGMKLVLIAIALYFSSSLGRRFFLAVTMLLVVAFTLKLSTDIFNNHKLLNLWNVFASAYAAYALWMIAKKGAKQTVIAAICFVLMVMSAFIDLFPVRNDRSISVPHKNDALTTWVLDNTQPKDIFLSDLYLSHPILFSGRKIFLGNTLFAWTAGYDVGRKEAIYRDLFQETDPAALKSKLDENNISFVAIDDAVRQNKSIAKLNESVFEKNFEKVYTDSERKYANLVIFRVPRDGSAPVSRPRETTSVTGDGVTRSAFSGGPGNGPGQFKNPRGIAVGPSGRLYVADAGNSRVQVFSETGDYQTNLMGFEFGEPNGIAVDKDGNVYVTDSAKHKLVKFSAESAYQKEWPDPEKTTFYGPRGVAIGPDGLVYVVDQGNSRVVAIDPASDKFRFWGKNGSAVGEFAEPGGIEIFNDTVYVIDTLNNRIQSFSLDGTFKASWAVPEWDAFPWQFPDIKVDPDRKRFYVTSPRRNEILILGLDGRRLETMPQPTTALQSPAFMAIDKRKDKNKLLVVNNGGSNVSFYELGAVSSGTPAKTSDNRKQR